MKREFTVENLYHVILILAAIPYSPTAKMKKEYTIQFVELILNIICLFGSNVPCKSYGGSKFQNGGFMGVVLQVCEKLF
jgi:hypothetical protein